MGKEFKITNDSGLYGFKLNQLANFPYFVLEKVEEPIKLKIETYKEILGILKPAFCISGDFKKKWSFTTYYFYLYAKNEFDIKYTSDTMGQIKFKSHTIAHEAIMILGEETIILALK